MSALHWRPIETAPKDGTGFLSYGLHARDNPLPGSYKAGDHWWAIIQWDIWREPRQFVFGKDGKPVSDWGEPLRWQPLLAPVIAGSPALNQPTRSAADMALAAARLALARIANGDPQAMRLSKTALEDIETFVGPVPAGGGR